MVNIGILSVKKTFVYLQLIAIRHYIDSINIQRKVIVVIIIIQADER
jgi:hypothetical protein